MNKYNDKNDSPSSNKSTKAELQYDKLIKRIFSILESFFISFQDFQSFKELFDDVNTVGLQLLSEPIKNNEQFFYLWNNFLENLNNYFELSPEERLEHYIKSTTSHISSLVLKITTNSQDLQNTLYTIKDLLNSLGNKYKQDVDYISDKLYELQAILIQCKNNPDFQAYKVEIPSYVTKMISALEAYEDNELRIKQQIRQLFGLTADFELIFGKQKAQPNAKDQGNQQNIQSVPKSPQKVIKNQVPAKKSPSKIPPPNFLKNKSPQKKMNQQVQPKPENLYNETSTDTPTTMELQLQQKKAKQDEKERKQLVKELDDSLKEERKLNNTLDQINEEIASVRQQFTMTQVLKSETKVLTDRDNLKLQKQDLEHSIQNLRDQVKRLEKKREDALQRAKLDEEQHKFFAIEASIQNEFLKNLVRYTSQYSEQVQQNNKDFSTVIGELNQYINGGPEQQTVSFSNENLNLNIDQQKRINEKIDSDIDLLLQQQELYEQNQLIDIECSTIFEEINRIKEDIESEKKRKDTIILENKSLKTKKDTEQERMEERSRRLEIEIKKWNQKTEDLQQFIVPESEDDGLFEEYVSRSEFDPVQDLIEERSRIQIDYNKIKKSQDESDKIKIKSYQKKYRELTSKINELGNSNIYDNLQKRTDQLSAIRKDYEKSLEESIKLRISYVNDYTVTGVTETDICLALRELDRRNIQVDIDENLCAMISSRYNEILEITSELKIISDWLDDHFPNTPVQNATKLKDKLQKALEIVSGDFD